MIVAQGGLILTDTLTGMAVFASVVELGSFTKAADRLGMSKSAISKQVSRLEDRLGVQLMTRTTRRLSLTEAGESFYRSCARVVAEAEAAELEMSHRQEVPVGRLRVNVPVSFGLAHLGPVLTDFMRVHPGITLEVGYQDRFVDLIEEGWDVAVRIGSLPDSSLRARRICESRRVIAAAPAYWKRHGKPTHPEELRDHACFLYAYSSHPRDWSFRGQDGQFRVRVDGPLLVNNGELAVEAAIAGLGVVDTPIFLCEEEIRAGKLEIALSEYEDMRIGIHAVYPPSRHMSAKVRAFIDFLASRFSDRKGWV